MCSSWFRKFSHLSGCLSYFVLPRFLEISLVSCWHYGLCHLVRLFPSQLASGDGCRMFRPGIGAYPDVPSPPDSRPPSFCLRTELPRKLGRTGRIGINSYIFECFNVRTSHLPTPGLNGGLPPEPLVIFM